MTVALVLMALQIPPAAVSVNIIDDPAQTLDGPVITPACAVESIVIAFEAVVVPHKLVTVYVTVSMPLVTPVTELPATSACALLPLQVPPETVSVSTITEPIHTCEGPVITPA